ncbi:MAG TPA: biotin/lipoyl-containing protein, partial [Nannocystis sp.]
MPSAVKVPPLGESITEAVIASWRVKPGDRVAVDQPLVELETDKITVEVPSPAAGVVQSLSTRQGDKVSVGDTIAVIAEAGAEAAPPDTSKEPGPSRQVPMDAAEAPPASGTPAASAPAMPAARAEAARTGVDLSQVTGTGRGGRVLKEDVQRAAAAAPA